MKEPLLIAGLMMKDCGRNCEDDPIPFVWGCVGGTRRGLYRSAKYRVVPQDLRTSNRAVINAGSAPTLCFPEAENAFGYRKKPLLVLSRAEATRADGGLDATKQRCPGRHKLSPTLNKQVFLRYRLRGLRRSPALSTSDASMDQNCK